MKAGARLILILGLLLSLPSPSAAQEATERPFKIEVVLVDDEPVTDEPTRIVVVLREPVTGEHAVLEPDPVELRHRTVATDPLRPTFHSVGGSGTHFETSVAFPRSGEWDLILYPDSSRVAPSDLPDRPVAPDVISVENAPPGWLGTVLLVVIGGGLLLFALGGRRTRVGPPRKKPAPTHGGDSWWWGP
jgi:hypothetical protein